jgi:hypothetical protein
MLLNVYGNCPHSPSKLVSAPEFSKHLTTSHFPFLDAVINGECPTSSHKLIFAPELSKHSSPLIAASASGKCDVVK